MGNIIPVPALSTLGWVTDSENKIDLLVSHFFLSDYNQTYLYLGNVTSLPRIIEKYGDNLAGVIEELKSSLIRYLLRYYESVTVDVSNSNPDSTSSNISLNITIGVSENGIKNTFARLLTTSNGKMQQIAKINNF